MRILPPDGDAFARRLSDGATLAEAAEALPDPDDFGTHFVGLVAVRRRRLDHSWRTPMSAEAAAPLATPLSNPVARFTRALFGLVPASLALLVLRLTLALPFYKSGLTRWDGWFTLSFGAKALFSDEYRLHVFGQEIPFPQPELVATTASTAEIVLPILLAFGFLTRYAALGLLGMTAVIQLVYPDGWQNFHLPWAAMALAIMAFGPGALSIDRILGLDGAPPRRAPT